jgi:integrase
MLTQRFVNTVKTKGDYHDADGLYLQVGVGGKSKSWVLRYARLDGKGERNMGLGSASTVGLAKARDLARQARLKRIEGIDPIDARKQERQERQQKAARDVTFAQCVKEYLDTQKVERTVHGHVRPGLMPASWRVVNNRLRRHLLPALGKLSVSAIGVNEVKTAIMKIHEGTSPTAARSRLDLELILDFAKANEYREGDNPANLKGPLIKLMPWLEGDAYHTGKKFAALKFTDIAEFMAVLRAVRRGDQGRGVTYRKDINGPNKWYARVSDPKTGRRYSCGFHANQEDAIAAQQEAARKLGSGLLGERCILQALMVEFIVLTGVREGQLANARWEEFDLTENRMWRCPWQRTKKHVPPDHLVPLSSAAIELLNTIKAIQEADNYTGKYVFVLGSSELSTGGSGGHAYLGRPASPLAPIQWLKKWEDGKRFAPPGAENLTVHGLRTTLKTWSKKHGFAYELIEEALDHKFGTKVSRRYIEDEESSLMELAETRRPMLEAWADACAGLTRDAKVVPLRAAKQAKGDRQ